MCSRQWAELCEWKHQPFYALDNVDKRQLGEKICYYFLLLIHLPTSVSSNRQSIFSSILHYFTDRRTNEDVKNRKWPTINILANAKNFNTSIISFLPFHKSHSRRPSASRLLRIRSIHTCTAPANANILFPLKQNVQLRTEIRN